tara:strand:+ start:707 stop:1132 length:426 start_codon:yes stop_codon:yes gene_type:complete
MNIQPLHPKFKVPTKGTEQAGAYDLYMPEPGHCEGDNYEVKVNLGFAAELPAGHVALLLPRSGVGSKVGLELNNTCGVIDADYRGPWFATLRTKDGNFYSWNAGDRLLQMLIVPVAQVEFNVVDDLSETSRGTGGLGSTGK